MSIKSTRILYVLWQNNNFIRRDLVYSVLNEVIYLELDINKDIVFFEYYFLSNVVDAKIVICYSFSIDQHKGVKK